MDGKSNRQIEFDLKLGNWKEIKMGFESMATILEQIGVILFSAILLYLLYQGIERSRVSEMDMERTLQKAKVMRQEAMERSREMLSRAEK
jgi:hypothetical protein